MRTNDQVNESIKTAVHVDAIPADAVAGSSWFLAGKWIEITTDGRAYEPCGRCGGTGKVEWAMHVFAGDCFSCGGAKDSGTYRTVAEANRLAAGCIRAAEAKEAKRVAWVAKRDAEYAAIVAERPEVAAAVDAQLAYDEAIYDGHGGIDDAAYNATPAPFEVRLGARLSELRWTPRAELADVIAAELAKLAARAERDAADAAKGPAPLGKTVVRGRVVKVTDYDGDYGVTTKMTVIAEDGYRVFVTAPRALDLVEGDRGIDVEFTVTLAEGRDGDDRFRKGTRPSKARRL